MIATFIVKNESVKLRVIDMVSKLPLDQILEITIREHTDNRTNAQNRLMWSMLGDISKWVVWDGEKLTSEEWKDVITAAIKKQRVVRGIEGGLVILGAKTSKMKIKEMNEVI